MDPNKETASPAPEPKVEDTSKAPDVSMSMDDPSTAAPAAAAATAAPAAGTNPGHGLGIASLIVSILGAGLIGIILGAIGLSKSKKAGQKNGLAVAGIILGVLSTIVVTILIVTASLGAATLLNKCAELGTGTHLEGGVTYTCS